ncbi:unnamed protein product [Candidula unifasciata]|uniref:Uncharacterized protein n=1 Tax=Candidula unifasciata TaxID=100452 RepID=A0A8S3ZTF4_9EUPU|nr:unnamed protein product [Candidula unifasciata]
MPTVSIASNIKREQIPDNFIIATNLKREQIPDNFIQEASKLIASKLMSFGGTEEPCTNISLSCIRVVGPDKNTKTDSTSISLIPQDLTVWNGNTFG